jgi:hypothetical protein
MSKSEKSPKKPLPPLTPSQLKVAEENLIACLDGLMNGGEEGLQDALDQIYGPETRPQPVVQTNPEAEPKPEFRRVKIMKNSYMLGERRSSDSLAGLTSKGFPPRPLRRNEPRKVWRLKIRTRRTDRYSGARLEGHWVTTMSDNDGMVEDPETTAAWEQDMARLRAAAEEDIRSHGRPNRDSVIQGSESGSDLPDEAADEGTDRGKERRRATGVNGPAETTTGSARYRPALLDRDPPFLTVLPMGRTLFRVPPFGIAQFTDDRGRTLSPYSWR